MQISAANLIAAQQAAQKVLLEKSALAAKQAARAPQATKTVVAPVFSLDDLAAAPAKTEAPAAKAAAPAQPQPGAKLGQHINIVV